MYQDSKKKKYSLRNCESIQTKCFWNDDVESREYSLIQDPTIVFVYWNSYTMKRRRVQQLSLATRLRNSVFTQRSLLRTGLSEVITQ
jgi:hypothetical protein